MNASAALSRFTGLDQVLYREEDLAFNYTNVNCPP
jgi:hypothetical protein